MSPALPSACAGHRYLRHLLGEHQGCGSGPCGGCSAISLPHPQVLVAQRVGVGLALGIHPASRVHDGKCPPCVRVQMHVCVQECACASVGTHVQCSTHASVCPVACMHTCVPCVHTCVVCAYVCCACIHVCCACVHACAVCACVVRAHVHACCVHVCCVCMCTHVPGKGSALSGPGGGPSWVCSSAPCRHCDEGCGLSSTLDAGCPWGLPWRGSSDPQRETRWVTAGR